MKITTEPCQGCGKKRKLAQYGTHQLCSSCLEVSKALQTNPELLSNLISIAGQNQKTYQVVESAEHELPEVLDAIRYRTTDRDDNTWYISVSEMEGYPVEIFASTAFDRDHHLQSRISNLTTITRLISLILRHIFIGEKLTLDKVLTQLYRSSRQPNDLPEMLGRILAQYSPKKNIAEEKEAIIP
jgi:hypothetical protein